MKPTTPIRIPSNSTLSPVFTNTTDPATSDSGSSLPIRALVYGKPKTRKTWFSATAATRLRTTILDGDTNSGILNQLPPATLKNIQIAPMTTIGIPTLFPQFLGCMSGDETALGKLYAFPLDGKLPLARRNFKQLRPDTNYYLVNLDALSSGDLIIIDSYTTLISGISYIYNRDRGVDPMKGEVLDEEDTNKYRYFRYHEAVIKNIMAILRQLPCNIIITAHATAYETEIMVGKAKQKYGNIQLVSYSGTDGARAPALCSDVIYTEAKPNNPKLSVISTESETFRIGGCTHVAPATHDFPGWDMTNFLDEGKLIYPTPEQTEAQYGPWLSLMKGSEIQAQMLG